MHREIISGINDQYGFWVAKIRLEILPKDTPMLAVDLNGRRALVAGVADDKGYGFAIAKALAEAGA